MSNAYSKDGFNVSAEVGKLLDDYSVEVKRKATAIFESTAKEAARNLKQTSPRGKGANAGAYARGWTVKRQKDRNGLLTITVHNKDHYQLTHLLEHGHALPQGGRAKAQPHIETVEQWAQGEVMRRLTAL